MGAFCALLSFFLCFLRFLLFSISSSSPDDNDCVDDDDDDDDDDNDDDDNFALVDFSFFFLLAMERVAAAKAVGDPFSFFFVVPAVGAVLVMVVV